MEFGKQEKNNLISVDAKSKFLELFFICDFDTKIYEIQQWTVKKLILMITEKNVFHSYFL